ncbi:rRNA maturation RNase YbeY [Candidatus Saccharibacteria bacterium]|nr:rRNA maturation RNase YbeY [Candidatus Saccharibacteria bacterium]
MAKSVKLEILGDLPKVVSETDLQKALKAVVLVLKVEVQGVINCIFVSPKAIQVLNEQFAGNDYPTDVLSFNYFEDQGLVHEPDTTLAEIAICSEIAASQAKEYKNSYADELVLLLVHGLLHVFGLDHANATDRSSFEAAQGAIMKRLKRNTREFKWLA